MIDYKTAFVNYGNYKTQLVKEIEGANESLVEINKLLNDLFTVANFLEGARLKTVLLNECLTVMLIGDSEKWISETMAGKCSNYSLLKITKNWDKWIVETQVCSLYDRLPGFGNIKDRSVEFYEADDMCDFVIKTLAYLSAYDSTS